MRILVVTGSSGGHIYPALAFLDSLPAGDTEALLVLPRKSIQLPLDKFSFKVRYLSIVPIKNFPAVFKFITSCFESLGILLRFKPEVVLSFGSLSGIPMILLARGLRIKTLLQEQNVIPGRANRFLAKFADKICVGFRESGVYFKEYPQKLIFTGNPIRKELKIIDKRPALEHFGFKEGRITILVVGGSQGSRRINSSFISAASTASWRERVQVIHISGPSDFNSVSVKYSALRLTSRVFPFLNDMEYAYSAADLVICRAGAITIAELARFKIPAIIIPYPFAYQHQKANASVLEGNNCVLVIDDKDLDNKDILDGALSGLVNSGDKLIKMRSSYDKFSDPDSLVLLRHAVFN